MDTLTNIRTFIMVVRSGSFSAAARTLHTAPSVVTKRIDQLEHQLKIRLFTRSTRKLDLTETGERYYPRFRSILTELDEAFRDISNARSPLVERLRIKCPTTLTIPHFGKILTHFQAAYPGVRMELAVFDRSVNPAEEGFDIAIGAMPSSFNNVKDIPLCPLPRVAIASPAYLDRAGRPEHPSNLVEHDCVSFMPTGTNWVFEGEQGPIAVDVAPRLSANDSYVLVDAVESDLGVAMVAKHIALPSLQSGRSMEVLTDFPIPDLWVKAQVPDNRMNSKAVQAALGWLRESCEPCAPWDRESDARCSDPSRK